MNRGSRSDGGASSGISMSGRARARRSTRILALGSGLRTGEAKKGILELARLDARILHVSFLQVL